QGILLRLAESVDLVEEEHRREAVEIARGSRLIHDLAHVFDAGRDGRELDEPPPGAAGDRLGEGRLAGARRAPQDDRHRTGLARRILGEVHERRPRAEQMPLARDLVEGGGAHPHRERRRPRAEPLLPGHALMLTAACDTRRRSVWSTVAALAKVMLGRRQRGPTLDRRGPRVASSRQQREQREARERLRAYQARQEVHEVRERRRRRDNVVGIVGGIVAAALAITTQVLYFTQGPGAPAPVPSASPTPSAAADQNVGAPDASLAEDRVWTGELVLNDDVTLGISLDGTKAPQAVAGWVQDVQDGYYVGKTCHRLGDHDRFQLIQCGSIDGTGAPDPEFSYGPVE